MINFFNNVKEIIIDDDLNEIEQYINYSNINYLLKPISKEEMIKNTKKFFELNDFVLKKISYINSNNIYDIYPCDLPIIFIDNMPTYFGAFQPVFKGNVEKFNTLKIYFKEFLLSNNITEFSSSVLVHEIAHTHVLNNNLLENYLNYDVLSIFLDKLYLYTYSKKLLFYNETLRLDILKRAVNILKHQELDINNKIHLSMVIESILISEHLFNFYLNKDAEFLVDNIRLLFQNDQTIENLLNNIEIGFDNSKKLNLIKNNLTIF